MKKIVDKNKLLNNLDNFNEIILELGCGDNKRIKKAIGIDIIDYVSVDIVGEVLDILSYFPNNSVDEIHSFHFFEHVEKLENLLIQCDRVLKYNGKLFTVVPHFSNPYYYSDYTHKLFFGLYSMSYFASDNIHQNKVPNYKNKLNFRLLKVDLIFKSPRPFYIRYLFKRLQGLIFNSCSYMREFYEENFTYIFPCYEIKYILEKKEVKINND